MDTNQVLKLLCHASTFFMPILIPLIVWILAVDTIVKNVALQALLFHILISILIFLSALFSFILIGIPFLIFFSLAAIICPIMGIWYSIEGRTYNYPIISRMIRS
ncbi:DUF4870 domain-containing protein [Brevibacillus daliensis]|uniref:DUF4870 domain-containing protein n=1 Tax=Brevibacillus daliensis TaxID=2892995 RepID=UPI001E444E9A|nr:DUF4870 domain-containing protein [Brevibacillus daliensis]